MEHLPTPEEQGWLLEQLRRLMAERGTAPFLEMPIVEPSRSFFPDPWEFSHRGLDRLVRRLMQYAGLQGKEVVCQTFVSARQGLMYAPHRDARTTPAGLFLGIADGCSYFGFNEDSPASDEYMAGVMAHEVAHAYRAAHGLMNTEESARQEEECLTDLTAVYLGFGILAANNSYRHRAAANLVGGLTWLEWTNVAVGYLPPQAFAFVLGVQFVLRELDASEVRRLAKLLEPNQAAFTLSAYRALLPRAPDVFADVGLPYGGATPRAKRPDEVLLPLPAYVEPSEEPSLAGEPPPALINTGRPVFRVRQTAAPQFAGLGIVLGMLALPFGWVAGAGPAVLALPIVGAVAGGLWGNRKEHDICSDPTCETRLEPSVTTCPGCGGTIAGRIRSPNQRLEAEEDYERQRKVARKVRRPRPVDGDGGAH